MRCEFANIALVEQENASALSDVNGIEIAKAECSNNSKSYSGIFRQKKRDRTLELRIGTRPREAKSFKPLILKGCSHCNLQHGGWTIIQKFWSKGSLPSVPGSAPGCRTGNREKLSSTQAEPVQAIKTGVAYFPSISCTTSWRRSRYYRAPE